jgi:hypothetical protein
LGVLVRIKSAPNKKNYPAANFTTNAPTIPFEGAQTEKPCAAVHSNFSQGSFGDGSAARLQPDVKQVNWYQPYLAGNNACLKPVSMSA